MQRKGIDYFDTFAPVCSSKSITTIRSVAASEDWDLRSYDVCAAYLEALIDTSIFISLPPSHPNCVVQLNKPPPA